MVVYPASRFYDGRPIDATLTGKRAQSIQR
jgi:hypothetical protein